MGDVLGFLRDFFEVKPDYVVKSTPWAPPTTPQDEELVKLRQMVADAWWDQQMRDMREMREETPLQAHWRRNPPGGVKIVPL